MESMVSEQNLRLDEVMNKYKYHENHVAKERHQTIWGNE